MTTELALNDGAYVALVKQQIMQSVNRAPTNDELQLFMATCQRTGLDPLMRQIYCIERRSKKGDQWVSKFDTQVSIDGMRLVAERTDRYEGQVGPLWCGDDGVWRDVWLSNGAPAAAKVGVWKRGFREPLWAVALYSEYAQTKSDGQPTQFWHRMPALMLAKCAESLALRKAFPNDLSGLYTREEMGQAENEAVYTAPVTAALPAPTNVNKATGEIVDTSASDKQIGFIKGTAKRWGWTEDDVVDFAREIGAEIVTIDALTKQEASALIAAMQAEQKKVDTQPAPQATQAPLSDEYDAIDAPNNHIAGVKR